MGRMPSPKSITRRIIAQRTPLVLERDYPLSLLHPEDPEYEEPVCCYCEQRFISGHKLWHKTWEHLDNDKTNQALWDLSWSHWHCNEKKKNDTDLQIQARDIIKKNREWEANYDFESASEREKTTDTQPHTEIDLSIAHFKVATEYLAEKINGVNPRYPLEDSIYSIVTRCRTLTGHGSSQATRGYLKELTCSENKYEIEKKDGKKFIIRRTGQ